MRACSQFAVGGDIGNVRQFVVLEAVRAAADLAQTQVQRTKRLGQPNLLILVQRLVAKDQHRMAIHGGFKLPHLLGTQGLAQVKADGFGADMFSQWCALQGHEKSPQ